METETRLTADQIRDNVAELLAANGITYAATYCGQRKREGWDCDAWAAVFTKGNADETFEYFTGLGHRQYVDRWTGKPRPPGWTPTIKECGRPGTLFREQYDREHTAPKTPHAADVLYSLVLDSSAVGQSFESWCSDYGYDTDSRKAEGIYRACQQNADKLARVMESTLIAELSALLQDY